MTVLARTLSWVFLPLNAPVIALLIALYAQSFVPLNGDLYSYPVNAKYFLLLVFSFFSIVVPGFTILFLRFSGAITTVMIDNRSERILPSVFVNVSAIALYFLLRSKDPDGQFSPAIYALSIGSTMTVLCCTIVTRWWKISLHGAGMGIISGFLFGYYYQASAYEFLLLPGSLLAAGIVMSARMYLGKHSLGQCLAGFAVGSILVAATVLALNPYYSF